MANGEEDLIEKNKGRRTNFSEKRYKKWSYLYGHEDSEMLLEKAYEETNNRNRKSKWDDED